MLRLTRTSVVRDDKSELETSELTGASIEALGSHIDIFFDQSEPITPTSEEFKHLYAENQIGEPFRLLLGQLIFPCLVARNF